jgi:hypothetical protein
VPGRATAGIVTTAQPLTGAHATIGRGGAFGPPVAGVQRATGQPIARVSAAQVVPRPRAASQIPVRAANDPLRSPVNPNARTGSGGGGPRASPRYGAPRSGVEWGGPGPRARGGGEAGRAPPSGGAPRPAPAPAPAAPSAHPHASEPHTK